MKRLSVIAILLLVAGAGVWYASRMGSHSAITEGSYRSNEIGLAFTYPPTYDLNARHDSFNGMPVQILTLIDASSTVPDMSKGPTAISIIKVARPATTTLEQWVRDSSITNFYLSPDKKITQTTVAGQPALAYRYSGLYESDAVAVEHSGAVYIFAASWMKADDAIRTDFKNLLSSVTFTQ